MNVRVGSWGLWFCYKRNNAQIQLFWGRGHTVEFNRWTNAQPKWAVFLLKTEGSLRLPLSRSGTLHLYIRPFRAVKNLEVWRKFARPVESSELIQRRKPMQENLDSSFTIWTFLLTDELLPSTNCLRYYWLTNSSLSQTAYVWNCPSNVIIKSTNVDDRAC